MVKGGYMGKYLVVDMTTGTCETHEWNEEYLELFIGGPALGARMLWDMMPAHVDALAPESVFGFLASPLNGTNALFGGRYTIVSKSPVTNGFNGRITLENVGFGSDAAGPAISIEDNSDVTLVCKGSNKLLEGIYVAEGSTLHIEGDGDLTLNVSSMEFFCIGAGPEKKHGDIIVDEFDGALVINGNGVNGVGIGSGAGGNIILNSANISVGVPGRSTVAIGNINGKSDISITACDLNVMCRSMRCMGIGTQGGSADINIADSVIYSNIDGRDAMFIGSLDKETKPVITNTTVTSMIKTAIMTNPPEDVRSVYFLNGTYTFDGDGVATPS